jgi:hypothetical protein
VEKNTEQESDANVVIHLTFEQETTEEWEGGKVGPFFVTKSTTVVNDSERAHFYLFCVTMTEKDCVRYCKFSSVLDSKRYGCRS